MFKLKNLRNVFLCVLTALCFMLPSFLLNGNSNSVVSAQETLSQVENLPQVQQADSVTLEYDLGGGTGTGATSVNVGEWAYLSAPSRSGYTFLGYTISNLPVPSMVGVNTSNYETIYVTTYEADADIRFLSVTSASNPIIYLTARWEAKTTYTITRNLGGGTRVGGSDEGTVDSYVYLGKAEMDGYVFSGWEVTGLTTPTYFAMDGSGTSQTTIAGQSTYTTSTLFYMKKINALENVTLTAQWTAISYDIAYELNGGSVGQYAPTSVRVSEGFEVSTPTLAGYTFASWDISGMDNAGTHYFSYASIGSWTNQETGSSVSGATYKYFMNLRYTGGTVTFTANWTPITYNISYVLDGGTAGSSAPATATYGRWFQVSAPTRTGYTFKGWDITGMTESDHSFSMVSGSIQNGTTQTSYTGSNYTYYADLRNTAGTVTFTATWAQISYTIAYELDGGSQGQHAPTLVPVGEGFEVSVPTRSGYSFVSWDISGMDSKTHYFSDASIGSWTTNNSSTSMTGVTYKYYMNLRSSGGIVTFTANWAPITYNIQYNLNGGTAGSSAPTSATYGSWFNVSAPTKENYTFGGWNITNMTASAHEFSMTSGSVQNGTTQTSYSESGYTYYKNLRDQTGTVMFSAVWYSNQITITWANDDGSTILQEVITRGLLPEYTGATPTKAATAQYTYTFAGWTPEISRVNVDTTYTATYTSTVNKYKITWKNDDGTVLETDTAVEYGVTPEYNGETPTKANSIESIYAFIGWSPVISAVSGEQVYTATYSSTPRPYTVTFKNHDGSILQTSSIPYGETPVYAGETPTKPETTQYTYTFSGWNPTVSAVTGEAMYIAQFTPVLKAFTVTWKNEDGTVLETDTNVVYGSTPSYDGETPTKAEDVQYTYTFSGWTPSEVQIITADTIYTASFTSNLRRYTITWENLNGDLLETDSTAYGTMPSYDGATPTLEADAKWSYTFKEWSPAVVAVTGDATYVAQYDSTVNKYLITFKNYDGTVLYEAEVPHGNTPSFIGETPVRPADTLYTYTFSGWSPAIVEVTGVQVYTAQFTQSLIKFTITWVNYDDSVLGTNQVEYGTMPVYDHVVQGLTHPYKPSDDLCFYDFAGWEPEVVLATQDATYKATFVVAGYYKCTIKFVNYDGEVLQEERIRKTFVPTYNGETPVREADAQYTYTFAGWDKEIVAVTEDATYTATYTTTLNSYTVTWKNHDGSVLETDTNVDYGTMPEYNGETPTKPADAENTYVFSGWNPTVSAVTGNVEYTAVFNSSLQTYTVTWKNYDGTVLETDENVAYGSFPVYNGETPTRPADASTYLFAGWDKVLSTVIGDVEYTATYSTSDNVKTVSFESANTEYGSVSKASIEVIFNAELTVSENYIVANGITVSAEPVAATAQYEYKFVEWQGLPTNNIVTDNVTITAVFERVERTYTVTWKNHDGSVLETDENVAYGATPEYNGATPTKAEDAQYTYTFKEWNPAVTAVESDVEYTAVFDNAPKTYTVTWKNHDGSVLETDENVAYGATPEYNGETPTKAEDAQYTYTFDTWSPAVAAVTGNVEYTATFTQAVKKYTVTVIVNESEYGSVDLASIEVEHGTVITVNENVLTFGSTTVTATPTTSTQERTYAFVEWQGLPTNNTVVEAVEITAVFSVIGNTYTITYKDVYDAQFSGTHEQDYPTSHTYGIATQLKGATKEAYTFAGWFVNSNGTGTAVTELAATEYNANITLYAKWIASEYTIAYNLNGGEVSSLNPTTYTIESANITLVNPTKDGYTFAGWTGSNGTVAQTEVVIALGSTGNKEYTANWTAVEYTISYTLNGGEVATQNPTTYTIETAEFTLVNPTKVGYTFAGWTGSNGTVAQTEVVIALGSTGNKEYTANWTAVEYTITYNLNNGTVASANPTTYTIETADVTLVNPTREGYVFLGWTGTDLASATDSVVIALGSTGNREYTANWKAVVSIIATESITESCGVDVEISLNTYFYEANLVMGTPVNLSDIPSGTCFITYYVVVDSKIAIVNSTVTVSETMEPTTLSIRVFKENNKFMYELSSNSSVLETDELVFEDDKEGISGTTIALIVVVVVALAGFVTTAIFLKKRRENM